MCQVNNKHYMVQVGLVKVQITWVLISNIGTYLQMAAIVNEKNGQMIMAER
jgi:hypothetical protein